MSDFRGSNISGDVFEIHGSWVTEIVEHFDDEDKFITVSEDRSVAVVDSDTQEVIKVCEVSKSPITAASIVKVGGIKKLLLGNENGELELLNRDFEREFSLESRGREIKSIIDFEDGTIMVTYGDDRLGSTIEYLSLDGFKTINTIDLIPTRRIRSIRRIEGVKDKAALASSAKNLYWLKVLDGELQLILEQPSMDDFIYDDVWANEYQIYTMGESYYERKKSTPRFNKSGCSGEKGLVGAMDSSGKVFARVYQEKILITDMHGDTINEVKLYEGIFPSRVKILPHNRLAIGFHTGCVACFEFREHPLKLVKS
ncbi:MAG: hypothetical protein KAG61_09420 [Bacteriovoracaceae bacterium]|nr:hypothetical protein [Bacteriovoracaceae bacterium]